MVDLKTKLLRTIEKKGYLTLNELYEAGREEKSYRQSTIERELRHLRAEEKIQSVTKNGKNRGHLMGYKLPDDRGHLKPINPQPLRPKFVPVDYRVVNNII